MCENDDILMSENDNILLVVNDNMLCEKPNMIIYINA